MDLMSKKSNSQILRESKDWAEKRRSEIFETDNFKRLGKEHDYIFQALAFMGKASREMSLANTVIAEEKRAPASLIKQMKSISQQIRDLQEELREI